MYRQSDRGLQPSDHFDRASRSLKGETPAQADPLNHLLVCHEWDNTIRWQPSERLHHLFEQRVDQLQKEGHRQHLAVDSLEGLWTYQQLDERANQIARYLKRQGLGSGDTIGLLFDKSVYSYLSMLAVLKIHAAYVPLDPAFPEYRIAYIAGDANLKSILTLSEFEPLAELSSVAVIRLDAAETEIDSQLNTRLNEWETGQPVSELCYIIYTSGSTGRPKGVPIEQASICNFVRIAAEVYGYQRSDRVYQGLTLAFDFAVEEIWVPLIVGATLLPNRSGNSLLGVDLTNFLFEYSATAMCCVPTLLATLDNDLPDLRLLIVSGEACPQDLIARWHAPNRIILNAYGPTETTVTATLARPRPGEPVTIGKPLPTYSVIILEPGTENVLSFGKEGEIVIAGIGVAHGYLNRQEQTKKAFINDFLKIENNPSGLLYRTGDLGLINAQGEIEYRGRIDLQVKIRGYRIELTEIESVMLQIPQIAQAAVDTFELRPGVKELVAWYTLKNPADTVSRQTLIDRVRATLPDYMVPAYYEHLDIIPMMTSDKVDRKALPMPSDKRMNASNRVLVEPHTPMETAIAQILADLLELDRVSVDDNFFDHLGANSLLMAQFGAMMRERIEGIDISMQDVYAHPTVAELAGYLHDKPSLQHSETSNEDFYIPGRLEYFTCGAMQLTTYLLFSFFTIWLLLEVRPWIFASHDPIDLYLRLMEFSVGLFFGWVGLAIAIKWLFVGRWKADKIPIWSFKYYCFWLMKQITVSNPMILFKGSPLYNLYLRMMGAHIGRNVVIEGQLMPLCADLLTIGDNTILRNDSAVLSYKARSNYIYTGSVTLGNNVIVGEGSVVDLDTVMEDGAQLGHASCLCEGQKIPENRRYHGNPAEETSTDFRIDDDRKMSSLRPFIYSLTQLLGLFIGPPVLIALLSYGLSGFTLPDYKPLTQTWALHLLGVATTLFMGLFFIGLISNTVMPRLLNCFIKVDQTYALYGVHFIIYKMIQGFSNSASFNLIFGDSSFIIHYLKRLGYQLHKVIQTGSNFGLEHKHDNPFLCHFGSGTMISDGFTMINMQQSSRAFRLTRTTVGDDNFVGNNVYYPPRGKTGNNCLIATKAMVPVDGKVRENTGLLGSPCFQIPRTTEHKQGDSAVTQTNYRRQGLNKKNRHNLATIIEYMICHLAYIYFMLLAVHAVIQSRLVLGAFEWMIVVHLFLLFSIGYFILMERAAFAFDRMTPITVSIYDKQYWQVEAVWKYSETFLRKLWLGTPFRSIINRLLGMKVGEMVFDDGLYVSEKTLVEIGDYCNFNTNCVLQSHSLEEGIYKSDYIKIGDRSSVEARAFVHYGTTTGNHVRITADSFVMKGESLANRAIWGGNPAKLQKMILD